MNVLSICGSLRPNSYNLALLRELKDRLRPDTDSTIFDRLGEIPPFQPDIPCPEVITDLRAKIKSADAIIIASPEYVHGIPGILKNALDWIVGSGEWDGKPTAIINVTPSANDPIWVRDGLTEVIRVMSGGKVLERASFMVTGAFKKFDSEGGIIDEILSQEIKKSAFEILQSLGQKSEER